VAVSVSSLTLMPLLLRRANVSRVRPVAGRLRGDRRRREVGGIYRVNAQDENWFWGVSFQTDQPQELRGPAVVPRRRSGQNIWPAREPRKAAPVEWRAARPSRPQPGLPVRKPSPPWRGLSQLSGWLQRFPDAGLRLRGPSPRSYAAAVGAPEGRATNRLRGAADSVEEGSSLVASRAALNSTQSQIEPRCRFQ
jgi:hypothetical protein